MDARDLPLHPLVKLLPRMAPREYEQLKLSIQSRGVKHEVWTWHGQVVDGRHRRQACIEIGRECPCREWDGSEEGLLDHILDVNEIRRHMSESRRAMLAAAIVTTERGRPKKENSSRELFSQDDAAAKFGVSLNSVKRAAKVLARGCEELVQAVSEDRITVKVAAVIADAPAATQQEACLAAKPAEAAAIASRFKQQQQLADLPTIDTADATCNIVTDFNDLLTSGTKFGCIYADPPWKYGNQGTRASTDKHYSTMTMEELEALPVRDIAAEKSHLWLWTTNGFLFECPRLFDAWGFEFKSSYVWVKPQMGIGNYLRNSHEFLLLGTRGGLTARARNVKSWGEFNRGQHSAKPEEIRKTVLEPISPGPYLEMFSRKVVPGWTVWGNQVAAPAADERRESA